MLSQQNMMPIVVTRVHTTLDTLGPCSLENGKFSRAYFCQGFILPFIHRKISKQIASLHQIESHHLCSFANCQYYVSGSFCPYLMFSQKKSVVSPKHRFRQQMAVSRSKQVDWILFLKKHFFQKIAQRPLKTSAKSDSQNGQQILQREKQGMNSTFFK